MNSLLTSSLYFSYGQLLVFDASAESEAGLEWTDEHTRQGFARRDSSVSFATIAQFGNADVHVYKHRFVNGSYARAVAVPMYLPTGAVKIIGPEEYYIDRHVVLEVGHYRLVAAQRVILTAADPDQEDTIGIDLFFEALITPIQSSSVLVADAAISPNGELVEKAEVAT
jgi:hypothetical protein